MERISKSRVDPSMNSFSPTVIPPRAGKQDKPKSSLSILLEASKIPSSNHLQSEYASHINSSIPERIDSGFDSFTCKDLLDALFDFDRTKSGIGLNYESMKLRAAIDDGTPDLDLPEFSRSMDLFSVGINHFVVTDSSMSNTFMHVRVEKNELSNSRQSNFPIQRDQSGKEVGNQFNRRTDSADEPDSFASSIDESPRFPQHSWAMSPMSDGESEVKVGKWVTPTSPIFDHSNSGSDSDENENTAPISVKLGGKSSHNFLQTLSSSSPTLSSRPLEKWSSFTIYCRKPGVILWSPVQEVIFSDSPSTRARNQRFQFSQYHYQGSVDIPFIDDDESIYNDKAPQPGMDGIQVSGRSEAPIPTGATLTGEVQVARSDSGDLNDYPTQATTRRFGDGQSKVDSDADLVSTFSFENSAPASSSAFSKFFFHSHNGTRSAESGRPNSGVGIAAGGGGDDFNGGRLVLTSYSSSSSDSDDGDDGGHKGGKFSPVNYFAPSSSLSSSSSSLAMLRLKMGTGAGADSRYNLAVPGDRQSHTRTGRGTAAVVPILPFTCSSSSRNSSEREQSHEYEREEISHCDSQDGFFGSPDLTPRSPRPVEDELSQGNVSVSLLRSQETASVYISSTQPQPPTQPHSQPITHRRTLPLDKPPSIELDTASRLHRDRNRADLTEMVGDGRVLQVQVRGLPCESSVGGKSSLQKRVTCDGHEQYRPSPAEGRVGVGEGLAQGARVRRGGHIHIHRNNNSGAMKSVVDSTRQMDAHLDIDPDPDYDPDCDPDSVFRDTASPVDGSSLLVRNLDTGEITKMSNLESSNATEETFFTPDMLFG